MTQTVVDDRYAIIPGRTQFYQKDKSGKVVNAEFLDSSYKIPGGGWLSNAEDMARFGVQFVASPRHADGIVITGAVNQNMREALERTYAAVPDPRLVIAVGACALSGGPFRGSTEAGTGVPPSIPVDLWIAGCPPHPLTILDGLLRLLGKLPDKK